MDNEETLKSLVQAALASLGLDVTVDDIIIERSKNPIHGDYATNAALKFAKSLGKNPRDLANELLGKIDDPSIEKTEIAGPGFINFFMKKDALAATIRRVLHEGNEYGRSPRLGKKIDVEYVSANPTGDLHLGHTRCAAVGDSLANLLDWAGYDVTREFYVNDCGNQIEHLGHSLRVRYLEQLGIEAQLDEDDYHGEDLILIAKAVVEKYGDRFVEDNQESHDFFIRYGIDAELEKIWKDLADFRVHFDKVSYESDIRKNGNIEKTIAKLSEQGYVYESEGATYLKTTAFLDDKDRPIVKSNGLYTYFMPDICYHYDKMSRGFNRLIDVLGADHHGYLNRMKSALMMKGYPEDCLDFVLVQVVKVFRDGQEVKMSKRTGKAIAHRDLVEDVGVDAVRYLFIERSQSSHLEFNYNLAMEQSSANPVFYVQYAHARCCSLLSLGADLGIDEDGNLLQEPSEMSILKHLADFPSMIKSAAEEKEPSKVAAYLHRLAELFHEFYAACRVIDRDKAELTRSRLALIQATKITLENGLRLLGVSAPQKM